MIQQTERNADEMGVALAGTQVADWRELDKAFGANRFDDMVCLGTAFTHLFDEDGRHKALEEMPEVLHPGGLLVLSHPKSHTIHSPATRHNTIPYICTNHA